MKALINFSRFFFVFAIYYYWVIYMHKKVVVLGGGTGISYLLRGLKDFPVDITAIITVSDNGSSTGKL